MVLGRVGEFIRRFGPQIYSEHQYYIEHPKRNPADEIETLTIGVLRRGRSLIGAHTEYLYTNHMGNSTWDYAGPRFGIPWGVLEHIFAKAAGDSRPRRKRHVFTDEEAEAIIPTVAKRTGISEDRIFFEPIKH